MSALFSLPESREREAERGSHQKAHVHEPGGVGGERSGYRQSGHGEAVLPVELQVQSGEDRDRHEVEKRARDRRELQKEQAPRERRHEQVRERGEEVRVRIRDEPSGEIADRKERERREHGGGELQPELRRVMDPVPQMCRVVEQHRIRKDAGFASDLSDPDVMGELVVDETGAKIERPPVIQKLEKRLVNRPVEEVEARVEEQARLQEDRREQESAERSGLRPKGPKGRDSRDSDEDEPERSGPGKARREMDGGEPVDAREDTEGG